MRFKSLVNVVLLLAFLFLIGLITLPLAKLAKGNERKFKDAKVLDDQALIIGILGGYRSLIADFAWIKAYKAWEEFDSIKCMANIELAAKLDPEVEMFWHLGSGIMAYDIPMWILAYKDHTPLQKKAVHERQAKLALDFLDRGIAQNPNTRRLHLDKAAIYLMILKDPKSAIKCYAQASKGNAPLFIIRDYARLLEQEGMHKEAIADLKKAEKYTDKTHPAYPFLKEHI